MDSLIGFVGADYVLLMSDTSQARSILKLKATEDKIMVLEQNKAVAHAGPQGDRENFVQYLQKNLALYRFRTGQSLTTDAAANFARTELSKALRRNPYQVNLLMGGFDEGVGPSLYYIDYLGSMHQMPFGAHGYASNFVLGMFDRYYKPGLSLEDGLKLADLCIQELQTRFLIAQTTFAIKIVNKEGVKVIRDASAKVQQ